MDTSPEYINMCRKARELQENHIWQDGDWIFYAKKGKDELGVQGDCHVVDDRIWVGYDECWEIPDANSLVWLPRIDQYLDQLGKDYPTHEGFTMSIKDRSKVEQELLADLYKKNYCKIWNGEDWIL